LALELPETDIFGFANMALVLKHVLNLSSRSQDALVTFSHMWLAETKIVVAKVKGANSELLCVLSVLIITTLLFMGKRREHPKRALLGLVFLVGIIGCASMDLELNCVRNLCWRRRSALETFSSM